MRVIAERVLVGFVLGSAFGSFLGVCVYRIPRGISIVHPPSYCPECGHRLSPVELIPIMSYLVQRGRCRRCNARIPARYFLLELGAGVLGAVLGFLWG